VFTLTSRQVLAADDEWTDYDPCGWTAEQEPIEAEIVTTFTTSQIGEDYYMN
jgi:hypothetical protein